MKNKGFTIVESLVAIAILVLVVTGTTSAIQTGISSYIFSKDQIIAFYLAQEGFEQIRNLRDENGLKDQPWLRGISEVPGDPCYFGNACIVDPLDSGGVFVERCSAPGNCPILRQNSSTGFFGYDDSSWPTTIFRREVVLTQIPLNAKEISITVTVNWSKGVVSRQFKAKENLLSWQQ